MRCSLDAAPSSQKPMLPRFPDANGDEEGMLREMAVAGFEKRIAKIPDQKKGEYRARLATELDILCAQGFAGYFLIVARSEEHTSELQSLMRISYAVFCLKKKKHHSNKPDIPSNTTSHNT